jgi:DNA recombination protein RmuC
MPESPISGIVNRPHYPTRYIQLIFMNTTFTLLTGAALGGVVAWLILRTQTATFRERLQARETETTRLQNELATRDASLAAQHAALDAERAAHAATRTSLAAERASATEKIAALTDAQARALTEFKALAASALQANSTQFLDLAKESLGRTHQLADSDLEKRQLAIDALVKPLRETLAQVDAKITAFDKTRGESAAALAQQLQSLTQSQTNLQHETSRLSTALRSTTTAGTWGELQLRRVVELAGMTDYCDFTEQASVTTATDERARLRPDLVVRLPGGQQIVIDAKAPNEAYRDAASAPDEPTRAAKLAEHAAKVSAHVNALGAKAYWEQFKPSPEFVVLFLPGDQFLAGALSADPDLLERAITKKVLLATPATLIALLKAAAYGWRQENSAKNAEEIATQARLLYDRVTAFTDHLIKVGPALDNAAKAYNAALSSFESRVLPAGRRLEELGAKGDKALPASLPAADVVPRELTKRD